MGDGKEASWNDAELASLLAGYFGEKLSPPELERLVTDVAAGLKQRRGEGDTAPHGPNVSRDT